LFLIARSRKEKEDDADWRLVVRLEGEDGGVVG
jgi:hypothetical protein